MPASAPEPEADATVGPPPPQEPPPPFQVYHSNPLTPYRTLIAARGLRDINDRLAEGWELIMGEFCEEVLTRSPSSRLPTSTVYRPYAVLGKRQPLLQVDRAALADREDRAAALSAIPLTHE